MSTLRLLPLLLLALSLTGCDTLFGSKDDPTTDEIFEEGEIDPTLLDEVGYVPLNPFFTQTALGTLDAPQDVYVGYDEFLYAVDAQGLHVLDLAGRPQTAVQTVGGQPLRDAGCVIQDRRLHVYVCARRDTTVNGRVWDLPVVYHLDQLAVGGGARVVDIIWHPFDDGSRQIRFTEPTVFDDGAQPISDEEAEFTGVGVLDDNRIYVSRRGPLNSVNPDGRPTSISPFNVIMEFTPDGENTQRIAFDPTRPSLRSSVYPSDVLTFFHPPQRSGLPPNDNFVLAQAPPPEANVVQPRFSVLSIVVVETPDGIEYRANTSLLNVASDPENGDGFLYEEGKFEAPSDLALSADGTNRVFVLDAARDSLFIFNGNGVEGVAPPPGAGSLRPIVVSFGGEGSGPLSFRDPQGVAYYDRTVYVADTGNDRISRFRLNTDFE